MNRSLWKRALTKTMCPPWPCPVCNKGVVALVPDSLIRKETVESLRAHHDEDWFPEFTTYSFTAWARCRNALCKQEFAISGTGGVDREDGPEDWEWQDFFLPMACSPMPDMFDLPSKCPDDVKAELRAAFALFWLNQAACAGRVRVALERLMNYLDVSRSREDKSGKDMELSLHSRIESFTRDEPIIGSQLMALKWLGNTGSHDKQVSKDDLLDAFEILEHALGELINRHSERVAQLAKRLTEKHGR